MQYAGEIYTLAEWRDPQIRIFVEQTPGMCIIPGGSELGCVGNSISNVEELRWLNWAMKR